MSLKEKVFPFLYKIFGRNSFAQAGEDAVLSFLWQSMKIKIPTYLELGVCDPRNINNTYLYYLHGGSGVLVEADSSQIPFIKKQRPRDKVIHAGVSTRNDTSAKFYVFDINAINTFSEAEARARQEEGRQLLRVEDVPLLSINDIIKQNFATYPQFLSIDIEGLDFEVLNSLDTVRFPIPVICAETCIYSDTHIKAKDTRFGIMMEEKGYLTYADTYLNTIFVNRNWFHNLPLA